MKLVYYDVCAPTLLAPVTPDGIFQASEPITITPPSVVPFGMNANDTRIGCNFLVFADTSVRCSFYEIDNRLMTLQNGTSLPLHDSCTDVLQTPCPLCEVVVTRKRSTYSLWNEFCNKVCSSPAVWYTRIGAVHRIHALQMTIATHLL